MKNNNTYPNVKQSIILLLLFILLTFVLTIPFAIIDAIAKTNIGDSGMFQAVMFLVSFIIILWYGYKKTKLPINKVFVFKLVPILIFE